MSDAHEHHKVRVSTGGRIFINFRSADNVVVNTEEKKEADDIVNNMNTTYTR